MDDNMAEGTGTVKRDIMSENTAITEQMIDRYSRNHAAGMLPFAFLPLGLAGALDIKWTIAIGLMILVLGFIMLDVRLHAVGLRVRRTNECLHQLDQAIHDELSEIHRHITTLSYGLGADKRAEKRSEASREEFQRKMDEMRKQFGGETGEQPDPTR